MQIRQKRHRDYDTGLPVNGRGTEIFGGSRPVLTKMT
jgi:hypothetical protein